MSNYHVNALTPTKHKPFGLKNTRNWSPAEPW